MMTGSNGPRTLERIVLPKRTPAPRDGSRRQAGRSADGDGGVAGASC